MAETDEGMLLKKGTYAMAWDPEEGYSIYTPNLRESDFMPAEGVALLACLVRLENDPDFKSEMLKWFDSLKKG